MSREDIEAGARWNDELSKNLQEMNFGLICLTPENQNSHWILFEAGVLAKALDKSRVCPYLIGLEPAQITSRPLAQFQAKRSNKEETFELICAINGKIDSPLPQEHIKRTF